MSWDETSLKHTLLHVVLGALTVALCGGFLIGATENWRETIGVFWLGLGSMVFGAALLARLSLTRTITREIEEPLTQEVLDEALSIFQEMREVDGSNYLEEEDHND